MQTAAIVLVVLIGVLHAYILVLEMFLWTTKRGLRAFNMTPELAAQTATLAKNQGLYNGFLAAGLWWGAFAGEPAMAFQIRLFFLGCVAVAGLYEAVTVGRKILFIQTVPALIAAAVVVLAR